LTRPKKVYLINPAMRLQFLVFNR